jgi:hypothetical protein
LSLPPSHSENLVSDDEHHFAATEVLISPNGSKSDQAAKVLEWVGRRT